MTRWDRSLLLPRMILLDRKRQYFQWILLILLDLILLFDRLHRLILSDRMRRPHRLPLLPRSGRMPLRSLLPRSGLRRLPVLLPRLTLSDLFLLLGRRRLSGRRLLPHPSPRLPRSDPMRP